MALKLCPFNRVLNKEHFYLKNYAENVQQKLVSDLF